MTDDAPFKVRPAAILCVRGNNNTYLYRDILRTVYRANILYCRLLGWWLFVGGPVRNSRPQSLYCLLYANVSTKMGVRHVDISPNVGNFGGFRT